MIPRGILFDLDNTLAHRNLSIACYARRLVQDFHGRLAAPRADAVATLIIARDNGGYGVPGSPFPTVRDDVAATLASRLRWLAEPTPGELVDHWHAHFATSSVEMPGATALFDRLDAAGIPVGIVSNGAEASRRALVRHLGFDARIRTLVSSERAGARKPDGRIFELATRELGVPATHCWFVGDHPVNDIDGARAAGLRPLWLAGFHAAPAGGIDAHVLATLADLGALLQSSVSRAVFTKP